MALYPALYDWLVNEGGPLGPYGDPEEPGHLYWSRLPKDNGGKRVIVAAIPIPGPGPDYHLGSQDDDAGVLWFRPGVMFQARGEPGSELLTNGILDRVMQRMELLRAGGRTLPADLDVEPFNLPAWEAHGEPATQETLQFAGTTTPPNLLEQDTKERLVFMLSVEVWHRPVAFRPGFAHDINWRGAGGLDWPGAGAINWRGI